MYILIELIKYYLRIIMMSVFSKFLAQLSAAKTQFVTGDAASAAAGAMIYVSKSGGISDEEFDMLVKMMRSNPRFEGLDVDALVAKWEGYASDRMMKRDLMDLLESVSVVKEQAEDVMISAIEVADAQDGIDDDEMARLKEIGVALKTPVEKYL